MAIYKNKASQKILVFAVDSTGAAKTGDAANITARLSLDGAAVVQTGTANPTEISATYAPGVYYFPLTQAETNADMILLYAKSTTSGVVLRPIMIYTEPEERVAASVTAAVAVTPAPPTVAQIRAEIDANSTKLDVAVSSRLAGASYTAPLDAAGTRSAVGLSMANLETLLSAIDTVADAIKAQTDKLTFQGSDVIATLAGELVALTGAYDAAKTAANQASIDAIDADVAAILEDTGTTLPASIAAIDLPTTAEIRQEMDANSTKLAHLDANVSTRLAASAYTAPTTPPTAEEIDAQLSETHGAGSWEGGGGTGDAPTVEEIDAALTAAHGAGSWQTGGTGGGTIPKEYTVVDTQGRPVAGALVEVYSEEAMTNLVARDTTDTFGVARFDLDPGTYWLKSIKPGSIFQNPDMETVP